MPKSYEVSDLLALNQHISEDEFRRIAELLERLQKAREGLRGFSPPPTSRHRRIVVGEGDNVDSRTVRLGRHTRR